LLTFAAARPMRSWPADVIARLAMVGSVFAQWIARSRREMELRAAHAEITRLKERLETENVYLRQSVRASSRRVLVSHSPVFNAVLDEISQVAPTNSTVLLFGETGTGKEVLADLIHGSSARKDRPMVKISCAALPPSLIEAELFGREKGAYTGALARQSGRFEIADGSTIFLDEVGELPLELQSKLLRVLQDGSFERLGSVRTTTVDVRVIAATNRDLARAVGENRFREDLYFRLNVFPIVLPPLRERRADIPLLAWEFVKEFSNAMGKPIERIADESMAALQSYPWPGNIRELRNVIERAMILARGSTLHIALGRSPLPAPANAPTKTLEDAERLYIVQTLERAGWRVRGPGGAAEALGMKPTTLESRMKKVGVQRPGSGGP
jgi:formate hydrogenlyase transcriptional activator